MFGYIYMNYVKECAFYIFKISLLFGFVILYDSVAQHDLSLLNLSSLAFYEYPDPDPRLRKRT